MKLILTLALATLASTVSAQRLVLPDNHNFMESTVYGGNAGANNQWATAARRFQIIYDASHFTGKAGVLGPVLLTHIKFRGEDGEANLGGQVYSGVTVEIGSTSVTSATMVTTFATNRAVATTTMGTLGTTSVTLAPSVGSCPNNYIIDIDLVAIGSAIIFDPTSGQPNLLIDITCPTAPTNAAPLSLIPIQNTTAHGAGIRGKSVYTTTVASLTGTADTTPPVVGIEFAGAGGWPTELPARAENIGGGCGGGHATVYQAFTQDQPFDLGAGITFTPNTYPAPTFYNVSLGAPPIDLTKLNAAADSTTDDAVISHALGYTFTYPGGGSTTTIKPCTNGFVWLDSTMTGTIYPTTKANLLGTTTNYTARFMPFWTDFYAGRNTGMGTLAGLHAKADTSGGPGNTVTYLTWRDMGSFRTAGSATIFGHEIFNVQCVMYEATGVVEFRYGVMQPFVSTLWTDLQENAAIVGFTRGRIGGTTPSLDPQSRDLSHELLFGFSTGIEGPTSNVSLTGVATPVAGSAGYQGRMFGGQTLKWNVSNIPAGTIFAALNLDLGASQPGFQLPGLTAPGCMISTSLNPLVLGWETWVLPPANVVGAVPLLVPHGWEGVVITAQAIGIDVFGGPYLVPWSSNTIKYTVGLD